MPVKRNRSLNLIDKGQEQPGLLPLTGPNWHSLLTDAQYDAEVNADIQEHGYYRPDRDYSKPDPRHKEGKLIGDPRPDLTEDHAAWARLLAQAYALDANEDDGAYGTLDGLRRYGARLAPDATFGYRLLPGEISEEEWKVYRGRYLRPLSGKLTNLLKNLSSSA